MKRQRGRGRKPGGNPGNRPHESNGPEVKIRGTAAQIHEKYMQYARDAQSSGDRVRYENLMQHAEHYFRILAATMPRDRLPGMQQDGSTRNGSDGDIDDGQDGQDSDGGGENDASDDADEAAEAAPASSSSEESGEGANRPRRRRGRRRPSDGDRSESGGGGEGDSEAKSAIDALAKKQAAVAGG